MKFSIALIALVPATMAASLRSQAAGSYGKSSISTLTSIVALKGVTGDATTDDMDFIGKALITSYNDVHWEAGHVLNGQHTTVFVG
jgi:hypothetical protein